MARTKDDWSFTWWARSGACVCSPYFCIYIHYPQLKIVDCKWIMSQSICNTQLFFDSFNKIQVGLFVFNFGKKQQRGSQVSSYISSAFICCMHTPEIDGEIEVNSFFIFKGYLFFPVSVLVLFYYSSLAVLCFQLWKTPSKIPKKISLFKFEAHLFEMSKEANWPKEFFSVCDS